MVRDGVFGRDYGQLRANATVQERVVLFQAGWKVILHA